MHELINTITNFIWDLWYGWIFAMMVLESSFFPFPSEIAMVPAGYLSNPWIEGWAQMNFALAFLAWTTWAMVWATINYILWWKLGGPIIKSIIAKYWKYFFLTSQHYDKTEYFFLDHGSLGTFVWRLITGVRQIISIPAWVFKMHYGKFLLYTTAGAWLWNLILMIIWYVAGWNSELIAQYSFWAFLWSFIVVWITTYTYFQRRKYPNTAKTAELILLNVKWEILIQERTSISKYGEQWWLFGGDLEYQEKPIDAIIRETKEELDIDISETVSYIGKIQMKLLERHTIAKRCYFYDTTKKKIKDFTVLEWDSVRFISIAELEKLEGFIIKDKALHKLIFLIKKAQQKVEKQK